MYDGCYVEDFSINHFKFWSYINFDSDLPIYSTDAIYLFRVQNKITYK